MFHGDNGLLAEEDLEGGTGEMPMSVTWCGAWNAAFSRSLVPEESHTHSHACASPTHEHASLNITGTPIFTESAS